MQKNDKKIKLSISIMVSNSIDTIRKCMESLVPILENVSSELIIVDTGGTDGSIEIAKEYATEVVKFEWCNDFAKARNAGLAKARGEWFMFLDDDEWFEDVTEIVEFFNSEEYRKYRSASYHIHNYSNFAGSKWQDVRTMRMVKREDNTRFSSPIHEYIEPFYYPEKVLGCYLHHYGYVFKSEEENRKHAHRNISLLEDFLKQNPKDYRLQVQLIQEYNAIREFKMSENISLSLLEQVAYMPQMDASVKRLLGWVLHNIIAVKMLKKDYMDAYCFGSKFEKYPWINHLTKAVLCYRMIGICEELEKYEEIFQYAEIYEKII